MRSASIIIGVVLGVFCSATYAQDLTIDNFEAGPFSLATHVYGAPGDHITQNDLPAEDVLWGNRAVVLQTGTDGVEATAELSLTAADDAVQINLPGGGLTFFYYSSLGAGLDLTNGGQNDRLYVDATTVSDLFDIQVVMHDGYRDDFSIKTVNSAGRVTFHKSEFTNVDFSTIEFLWVVAVPVETGHTNSISISKVGTTFESPPEEQVQDILDFIAWGVDEGLLTGSGAGDSSSGRLNALRNMLELAADLIDAGEWDLAEQQLWDVFDRCDGQAPPPDFIEGDSATMEVLQDMIFALICSLD